MVQIRYMKILLEQHFTKNKSKIDLSSGDVDGNHTTALRGDEAVGYQGRKKRKRTNAIYLTDRNTLPPAVSTPVRDP